MMPSYLSQRHFSCNQEGISRSVWAIHASCVGVCRESSHTAPRTLQTAAFLGELSPGASVPGSVEPRCFNTLWSPLDLPRGGYCKIGASTPQP